MHQTVSRCLAALSLCALVACEDLSVSADGGGIADLPVGTGFDFYVLALSWSPGYCQSQGDRANQQQCGPGKSFDWIVHGLWPQFQTGYPEFCEPGTRERVPNSLVSATLDIMPSAGLIGHQWRKHGSCSGLDQRSYFETSRRAFDMIEKPDIDAGRLQSFRQDHLSIENAFLDENSALRPEHVGVTCDRRFLRDVRICITKDLQSFVSCPEVDRRHCKLPEMVVVPAN